MYCYITINTNIHTNKWSVNDNTAFIALWLRLFSLCGSESIRATNKPPLRTQTYFPIPYTYIANWIRMGPWGIRMPLLLINHKPLCVPRENHNKRRARDSDIIMIAQSANPNQTHVCANYLCSQAYTVCTFECFRSLAHESGRGIA